MKGRLLRVEIQSLEEALDAATDVIERLERGEKVEPREVLSFPDVAMMRQLLTPARLRLLRLIRKEKPRSVYELAKLAGRNRKAVEADLAMLVRMHLVTMRKSKRNGRKVNVPTVRFDRIQISMDIEAMA